MSGAAWREGITTWIFDIVIPIPSEFINSAFTLLPEAPINGGLQNSPGDFSAGACNEHCGRGGILNPAAGRHSPEPARAIKQLRPRPLIPGGEFRATLAS
jgi:hypothetical protein